MLKNVTFNEGTTKGDISIKWRKAWHNVYLAFSEINVFKSERKCQCQCRKD